MLYCNIGLETPLSPLFLLGSRQLGYLAVYRCKGAGLSDNFRIEIVILCGISNFLERWNTVLVYITVDYAALLEQFWFIVIIDLELGKQNLVFF